VFLKCFISVDKFASTQPFSLKFGTKNGYFLSQFKYTKKIRVGLKTMATVGIEPQISYISDNHSTYCAIAELMTTYIIAGVTFQNVSSILVNYTDRTKVG
jgi:hypothetical protein